MSSSYNAVMARKGEILKRATGIDYSGFTLGPLVFDYEGFLDSTGYELNDIHRIQQAGAVGGTALIELSNITALVRDMSRSKLGATILVKDEAANPSGSFKDRRASLSAYHARTTGYKGLIAATSGNYGAAVASQAARHRLNAIVIQEAFDSDGRGQPEILEKGRKCEALGAEVLQTTVGPELFYMLLLTLEETGYFNASLYTPFSILGIETLGYEIALETHATYGRYPDVVLVTHAGGGHVTGVSRGLRKAGAKETQVIAVSVDLHGLHMASDHDFNRKSFTTGHTGFSYPFTTWPDRVDVPKNAARPLRYMDRFVTVTQGEVFYTTELLARIEGLERGPAGNTSLAAAIPIAKESDSDAIVVVSETEYTGAGKSPIAQLEFARVMGTEILNGPSEANEPGKRIAIPRDLNDLRYTEVDLADMRLRYIRHAAMHIDRPFTHEETVFLAEDSRASIGLIQNYQLDGR